MPANLRNLLKDLLSSSLQFTSLWGRITDQCKVPRKGTCITSSVWTALISLWYAVLWFLETQWPDKWQFWICDVQFATFLSAVLSSAVRYSHDCQTQWKWTLEIMANDPNLDQWKSSRALVEIAKKERNMSWEEKRRKRKLPNKYNKI